VLIKGWLKCIVVCDFQVCLYQRLDSAVCEDLPSALSIIICTCCKALSLVYRLYIIQNGVQLLGVNATKILDIHKTTTRSGA
jgi:hypothetical protein